MPNLENFPLLDTNGPIINQIRQLNNIRLGFLDPTDNVGPDCIPRINEELPLLLETMSDDQIYTFIVNLSYAYAKARVWCEAKRKKKIALEVADRDDRKVKSAIASRDANGSAKKEKKISVDNTVRYSANNAEDKLIKQAMKGGGLDAETVVKQFKALGILAEDFRL